MALLNKVIQLKYYIINLNEYISKRRMYKFVGISNYSLDEETINRALVLLFPDLDQRLVELIETSQYISKSISDKLAKEKIFDIIFYFFSFIILQIIKELTIYKKYKFENNEQEN